jgi:RHS repeat-associated protein
VRVKVVGQTAAYYFIFTDRQGSVANMRKSDGSWVNGSTARYDAFGGYRTKPPASVNPDISDRGYTGHRQNNSAAHDLGLIYMNARYYLPEVGRFISADTIVPQPENPQSYNRYAYGFNNPVKYTDPSGHVAQCWTMDENGSNVSCDEWMIEAMTILGLEGGLDGAELSILFWQWFNDPDKLLSIYAYNLNSSFMFTRQLHADTANIYVGKDVVAGFEPGDIALLGHELEHVSQGTWQAWSIQGEVLAYQVEFRIREAMNIGQTLNTIGAMGQLDPVRPPYDARSYPDLEEARSGFLGDSGDPYNVWYEPNLPWGQEIVHRAWQSELVRSLIVNSASWSGHFPR